MMLLKPARLALALSVVSLTASADTPPDPVNMAEFAYGSALSAADASIRRIELQPVVILHIQRRDHRDIRVYDANNEPMPSLLLKKDGTIKTSSKNLKFSAEYRKGQVSAYVIDRGKDYGAAIDSLKLKWKAGRAPHILTFYIEHSANKHSWQTLINNANIINFDFKGVRLEQNEIDINKITKRYLRLVPIENKAFPKLAGITATIASRPHADYWWLRTDGLEPDAARPGHYQFSLSTGVSPDQFKLIFHELNSVMTGALYSYTGSDTKSRRLVTKDFESFAVSMNRKVVNANPVDIRHSSATRWEIAANQMLNIDAENLPGVMAAYPRYQLIFASDGDEPYTLVWGNQNANTIQSGDLVERIKANNLGLDAIPEVRTGMVLDNTRLSALAESRQKIWPVVLGVLVLIAVGIVLVIGYRRYRKAH